MTARAKFALMNATIVAMLVKYALVDHTPAKTLAISAVVSFIMLNGVMFYGIRLAAKRRNSK